MKVIKVIQLTIIIPIVIGIIILIIGTVIYSIRGEPTVKRDKNNHTACEDAARHYGYINSELLIKSAGIGGYPVCYGITENGDLEEIKDFRKFL